MKFQKTNSKYQISTNKQTQISKPLTGRFDKLIIDY